MPQERGSERLRNLVYRLAAVIELVAIGHPQGLRVLLGEAPEPTVDDLLSLMAPMKGDDPGTPVQTFSRRESALNQICGVEPILSLIEAAGGWEGIVKATLEVREFERIPWGIFSEGARWIGLGSRLNGGGHQQRIAERYGVSLPTVAKWREEVPRMIARLALRGG